MVLLMGRKAKQDAPMPVDMAEIGKAVEVQVAAENWTAVQRLARSALRRDPEDHWFIARLALAHHEMRQYQKALKLSEKALALAPRCPLVRWKYAGALEAVGRREDAILVWKGLLRQGMKRVATGPCGEGVAWTRRLFADCRFRIAQAHLRLGQTRPARRYLARYLADRRAGVRSIYSLPHARTRLRDIWPQRNRK